MALSIRTLTVATTVDDIAVALPAGVHDLADSLPGSVCVGRLVRLPAPMPGIRYGIWSASRGAYAVELVPHPDIKLVIGRRRKVAGLIHRTTRLHEEPAPPAVVAPAPQPVPATLTSLTTRSSAAAELHTTGRGLGIADTNFDVGGDDLLARALRVALWLCLRQQIALQDLAPEHLTLLPADRFRVDATAIAWEMQFRARALASGLGSSAHYRRVAIRDEIRAVLALKGLVRVYGGYRWPSEQQQGEQS